MTFKQTGVKTFKDRELKDFTWQIKTVHVDFATLETIVDVVAWENHAQHFRQFDIVKPEVWTPENVIQAVFDLDEFKGSVPVQ